MAGWQKSGVGQGGYAQRLRESVGRGDVGRGGHTVGVERVGEWEHGWCVVRGVLSRLGVMGAGEVRGTDC